MKRKAVFVDRDGTLIEEVNFLSRIEDMRLYPFTAEAIHKLKEDGFLILVVTNQSGIGRGIYDEAAMHSIHEEMQRQLDGAIDGFYFCPHLPTDGCECRKPNRGMIDAADADFDIDIVNSWMIGDKISDIETGHHANTRTALVLTGYGKEHQVELETRSTVISNSFGEAVTKILELGKR